MEGRGEHISSAAPSPAGECQQLATNSNNDSSHIHTRFTNTAGYDGSRLHSVSPAGVTPADGVVSRRQPSLPAACYGSGAAGYGSGEAAMHRKIKIVRGFATYVEGTQRRQTVWLGIVPPSAGSAACKRISAAQRSEAHEPGSSRSPFLASPSMPRISGHTAVDAADASRSGALKGLTSSLDGPYTLPPVVTSGRRTAGAFQPAIASQLRHPTVVEAMAMSARAGPTPSAGQPMLRTASLSSLGMAPPWAPSSSGPTLLLMTRSSSLGSSWTTNPEGRAAPSCGGSPSSAGGLGWYVPPLAVNSRQCVLLARGWGARCVAHWTYISLSAAAVCIQAERAMSVPDPR